MFLVKEEKKDSPGSRQGEPSSKREGEQEPYEHGQRHPQPLGAEAFATFRHPKRDANRHTEIEIVTQFKFGCQHGRNTIPPFPKSNSAGSEGGVQTGIDEP